MNLKFHVLFVLILCFNFDKNSAFFISKAKIDSIEKWTDVGVKAGEIGSNTDLKAAINLIDALGKAIPYAGPLTTLISGIMSNFQPSELSVVLDKLNEMNRKLDRLDERVSEVLVKIESVHIIAGYKSKVEGIQKLKQAYERFAVTPNNLTRDDFERECGTNKMLEFVHWIDNELSAQTQLPLKQVMLQDFDLKNYNYWSAQIVTMLSNAMFLHSTCVGVSGYSETTINETLNGRNGNNTGDIHTFQQVLTNVKEVFSKDVENIKQSVYSNAKTEVEAFMRDNVGMDHNEFESNLRTKMSEKYFWLKWVIKSWSSAPYEEGKQCISNKGGWYWERQNKRCLFVAFIQPESNGDLLANEIDKCKQKIYVNPFYFNKFPM